MNRHLLLLVVAALEDPQVIAVLGDALEEAGDGENSARARQEIPADDRAPHAARRLALELAVWLMPEAAVRQLGCDAAEHCLKNKPLLKSIMPVDAMLQRLNDARQALDRGEKTAPDRTTSRTQGEDYINLILEALLGVRPRQNVHRALVGLRNFSLRPSQMLQWQCNRAAEIVRDCLES